MKKLRAVLAILVCLLVLVSVALAGCGDGGEDDSLIGTWTDQEGFIEYEFRSDGILVLRFMGEEEQIPYTVEGGKLIVEDTQTGEPAEAEYTVEGDTLTLVGEGEEETLVRKDGTTAEAPAEAEDATESAPAGSGPGTRETPIPLGQEAQIGDWKITVTGATLDASDRTTDATYEPLEAGSQVVLVDVAATYVGEESGTIMMDMAYKFVGSGGNTYEWIPIALDGDVTDEGEVFPGASVSGYLSFAVASDQVSGGTLSLEEFSFEGERVFFAVE